MRILKFKTNKQSLNSKKIIRIANANPTLFKGYKGYLFSQDEDDRMNDEYTVNVFFDSEGDITVTEYNLTMLKDACRYFMKLNNHAVCKCPEPDYTTDDAVNNLISAKLTFSFE